MNGKRLVSWAGLAAIVLFTVVPLLPEPEQENCGICGVALFPKDNRTEKEIEFVRTLVKELLLCTQKRGKGATGVVFFYKEKATCTEESKQVQEKVEPALLKGPKSGTEFVNSKEFEEHIKKLSKETTMVIGHNRAPSQGSPKNNNNNHPVVVDPIYLVHNGHIGNDKALFKKYDFKRIGEVDTEVISQLLAHFGKEKLTIEAVQKALSELKGGWAVAFADKRDPYSLYLARDGCPMTYVLVPELELLVYDSELGLIEQAWKKAAAKHKGEIDFEKMEFKEKVEMDKNSGVLVEIKTKKITKFTPVP
jgi:glutamine phosphoribosylpyrophosphate amidotransferase